LNIEPIILAGSAVRLEPLSETHHAGLCEIGLDEDIWRLIPYRVATPEQMAEYIRAAFDSPTVLAFATVEIATGKPVGSTRFMNIDTANRRVEIGSTFLGKRSTSCCGMPSKRGIASGSN